MSTASKPHSLYDAYPEANTAEAVLGMLNRYERTAEGKPLTRADLLTQFIATAKASVYPEPYDLSGFHPLALFIPAENAIDWLQGLTAKGFEDALRDEIFEGWFEEQDPDADEDEFMSTPCVDCTSFDFEEVDSGLNDCSRGGVLLVSPYMRRA